MACPQRLGDGAAPYCTGAWTETPSLLHCFPFLCVSVQGGEGCTLGAHRSSQVHLHSWGASSGWAEKGDPCVARAGADRSGGGGDELHPRGRAGEGRGGRWEWAPKLGDGEGAACRPPSWEREVRGPTEPRPSAAAAAAAAADVQERSAEAGARRPLLFI